MNQRLAFESVVRAALASGQFDDGLFYMPRFGEAKVAVEPAGAYAWQVRFIAISAHDFVKRVTAKARFDEGGQSWSVEELTVSKRLDPFSKP